MNTITHSFLLILLLYLFSCRTSNKHNSDNGDCNYLDTTLVMVGVSNSDESVIANVIDFLMKRDVKVIGLNLFSNLNLDDSVLISSLMSAKEKIVISYDMENKDVDTAFFNHNHISHGPRAFYFGKNNLVTGFSLVSKNSIEQNVETFYLKLLQKLEPSHYPDFKDDTTAYGISYVGHPGCFISVNESDLKHSIDSVWKDKIVLIGYLGLPGNLPLILDDIDAFFTPTSRWNVPEGKPNMYSTVIMANIVATMFRDESYLDK